MRPSLISPLEKRSPHLLAPLDQPSLRPGHLRCACPSPQSCLGLGGEHLLPLCMPCCCLCRTGMFRSLTTSNAWSWPGTGALVEHSSLAGQVPPCARPLHSALCLAPEHHTSKSLAALVQALSPSSEPSRSSSGTLAPAPSPQGAMPRRPASHTRRVHHGALMLAPCQATSQRQLHGAAEPEARMSDLARQVSTLGAEVMRHNSLYYAGGLGDHLCSGSKKFLHPSTRPSSPRSPTSLVFRM